MASLLVADSNIVLGAVLPVPYTDTARQLVEQWEKQNIRLAAPLLFRYEVVAVIRRYVHQKLISSDEALLRLEKLLAADIEYHLDGALLKRAFELATQFNRPTAYDSQYLAVAERLGCEFWTADEKLFNAVKDSLSWVRWLGSITVQPGS